MTHPPRFKVGERVRLARYHAIHRDYGLDREWFGPLVLKILEADFVESRAEWCYIFQAEGERWSVYETMLDPLQPKVEGLTCTWRVISKTYGYHQEFPTSATLEQNFGTGVTEISKGVVISPNHTVYLNCSEPTV